MVPVEVTVVSLRGLPVSSFYSGTRVCEPQRDKLGGPFHQFLVLFFCFKMPDAASIATMGRLDVAEHSNSQHSKRVSTI